MSSSSDLILEHIANYLIFVPGAPSFWYSLNTSYSYGFYFFHRFDMYLHDYEQLLIVANMANYLSSGFILAIKKWINSIEGHCFILTKDECIMELERKRIDLNMIVNGFSMDLQKRDNFHVLPIEVKNGQSPKQLDAEGSSWNNDNNPPTTI